MNEFCCEDMEENIELGYIHHDAKHSLFDPTARIWVRGIIFYVDFSPHEPGSFKLTFCPFCGRRLE